MRAFLTKLIHQHQSSLDQVYVKKSLFAEDYFPKDTPKCIVRRICKKCDDNHILEEKKLFHARHVHLIFNQIIHLPWTNPNNQNLTENPFIYQHTSGEEFIGERVLGTKLVTKKDVFGKVQLYHPARGIRSEAWTIVYDGNQGKHTVDRIILQQMIYKYDQKKEYDVNVKRYNGLQVLSVIGKTKEFGVVLCGYNGDDGCDLDPDDQHFEVSFEYNDRIGRKRKRNKLVTEFEVLHMRLSWKTNWMNSRK
jgi:hypothetical protein